MERHRPQPSGDRRSLYAERGPRATRRGFLGLIGSGGALIALARLQSAPAQATSTAAASVGFFDEHERQILAQVVERIVGAGEEGAPPVHETDAIAAIERLCASLDPALTRPLPPLLRLVDWSPLLFDLTATRFTRMSAAERDVCLRSWMTSRFALRRQAFLALRNLSFLGYYSQPETWPGIGYAGPLLQRAGPTP